jgi:small-conductance mechanosensitive channel
MNMADVVGFVESVRGFAPLVRTIIITILVYLVFGFLINRLRYALLKKARSKKTVSHIKIFTKITKYVFLLILLLFIIFSYAGSWTGLGITMGLMTAALGWALQKPITGLAGWVMVVTRRPFDIGDRIIVGGVKGDVKDITLTHIYLEETGGRVSAEERSGRTIMVPNSVLFEKNIINYTLDSEFVLDEVVVLFTYESSLEKMKKLCLDAAKKHIKEFAKESGKEPYIRTYFGKSGVKTHVRYFAPTEKLQEISSNIAEEIFQQVKKTRGVEIAYPHREIISKRRI